MIVIPSEAGISVRGKNCLAPSVVPSPTAQIPRFARDDTELEPVAVPAHELFLIRRGNARQRNAERVRGDGETPQHIAQLLRQARLIDLLPLKRALANQAEHLGGFLGQAGARVEQSVALVEAGLSVRSAAR